MKPNRYNITNVVHAARVLKYLEAEQAKELAPMKDHGRPTHMNADGTEMTPPTYGKRPEIDLAEVERTIDDESDDARMTANEAHALLDLARRAMKIGGPVFTYGEYLIIDSKKETT